MKELTHFDESGNARMVDVAGKPVTLREAVARGRVSMTAHTLRLIENRTIAKGDVLGVARIAGIMAAKKTAELVPMCHPLNITSVDIRFDIERENNTIRIESSVKVTGRTGVEMEALTAVAVAALTIYDMCKSVDRGMIISDILLVKKKGGKSGTFTR